jgi:L-amino acid N-acyltransferase YncA
MAHRFRPAALADAPAMLAIYAPVVRETSISWEYEPPSPGEFASRIEKVLGSGFPWIVMEGRGDGEDANLIGYAYAAPYRDRYAYRFCCESTIYMHPDSRGRGLGKQLYNALLETLTRQGYAAVIGGLAYPNAASEALHRSVGFEPIGIHERIGFKFGDWLNLCLMQKDLSPREAPTLEKPIPFLELVDSGRLSDLLD